MKKYELIQSDTITHLGRTLYRIKALRDIGDDVSAGDLGGYIEKTANLSQEDDAWVYGDARVYGNARVSDDTRVYGNARVCGDAQVCGDARVYGNALVCGDALVCGNAKVYGYAQILLIGPIGSRGGFTTFFRTADKDIGVSCGCFRGNLDQFLAKVQITHGDNQHAMIYRMAADMAKAHIDLAGDADAKEATTDE